MAGDRETGVRERLEAITLGGEMQRIRRVRILIQAKLDLELKT